MLNTILFSALLASLAAGVLSAQGEWPAYGYDQHGQRYSPVAQINVKNVSC
jgi:glucose dehydrogenase